MKHTGPKSSRRPAEAAWNIVLIGVPYILLNKFGRFFLVYGLMAALFFLYPPLYPIFFTAVIIDSYLLLKKASHVEEKFKSRATMTILAIVWFMVVGVAIAVNGILRSDGPQMAPGGLCPVVYVGNPAAIVICREQQKQIREKERFNRIYGINVQKEEGGEKEREAVFSEQDAPQAPQEAAPQYLDERTQAYTSPDRRFTLLLHIVGDGAIGIVWDRQAGAGYALEPDMPVSGLRPVKWLEDGRLQLFFGCIVKDACDMYESQTAEEPWKLMLTEAGR